MNMTGGEIALSFRAAKDRRRQVEILAQLNACTTRDIVKVLLENGFAPEDLPKRFSKNSGEPHKREYRKTNKPSRPKRDPKTGKMVCALCGVLFNGQSNTVYCPACGKRRKEELERERRQREREQRAAAYAAAGPKRCADCGAVLENRKAVYCKACAAARKKESIRKSKQRKRGMTL